MDSQQEPARILVTGAAGQIGYILSHWIASGELYGERNIILHLFEIPAAQKRLEGLVMELNDCAFPYLSGIVATTDPEEAFTDIDCAFLVASVPLKPGQVRADMLIANAPIFMNIGIWLSKFAKQTCKVLVIGNPDNTNAFVSSFCCENLKKENFTSLSLLDHNRAISEIANKIGVDKNQVRGVIVWGNHGETMVPDITHATVETNGNNIPIVDFVEDKYLKEEFIEKIRHRAWDVLECRGMTSAASPSKSAIQHMKAWLFGTKPGEILSIGVIVPEDRPYGLEPGIVYSLPCTIDKNGKVHIVRDLSIQDWLQEKLKDTEKDLIKERDVALDWLQKSNH
ncbi:L-lactate dehydrogenase [Histomonas meleagridis]|uniref:L-lactate dehydrogenase n=1 Tax=Histomonas meleagridis TaxID=135588 RepID=UPI00355A03BA|nr:L-lactate dehydrogenase [Histomonas meleagridis]KAH0797687.1 L-lactate dehydrogenase [Histomonas meleagridis]